MRAASHRSPGVIPHEATRLCFDPSERIRFWPASQIAGDQPSDRIAVVIRRQVADQLLRAVFQRLVVLVHHMSSDDIVSHVFVGDVLFGELATGGLITSPDNIDVSIYESMQGKHAGTRANIALFQVRA